MIEEILVDDAVWRLRPDFAVLVITAEGLVNGPSDDRSVAWLRTAGARVDDALVSDPHVESWREAYRAFGAKPQRTRPSVDALLRRARKEGPGGAEPPLPAVNQIVDAYNAVSVEHVLPIGGEDLDGYRGPARLIRATGDEPFDTIADGVPAVDHPEPGEVAWRDDAGVTCRRWNWRQCVRTRVTDETKNALFLLERLDPYPLDRLREAGDDLVGRLRMIAADVRIRTRLIGARDRTC